MGAVDIYVVIEVMGVNEAVWEEAEQETHLARKSVLKREALTSGASAEGLRGGSREHGEAEQGMW